jgi:hypothetical protein
MKNKASITQSTIHFKWILIFPFLFVLLFVSSNIKAQLVNEKMDFNSVTTNDYVVKEFTVKEVNDKLYFRFLVVESETNISYTLESSSNGKDFYPVNLKEGFKSPNNVPLLYCYSTNADKLYKQIYRIKRESIDGDSYSSLLKINDIENLVLLEQ